MSEQMKALDGASAEVVRGPAADGDRPALDIKGRFDVVCYDKDGTEKWHDHIDNVVATVGTNLLLDTLMSATSYAVVGPYMGLIGSTGWAGATSSGDTMAAHTPWTEAGGSSGGPTYSGTRRTCVWSAAASRTKSLSAALSFNFTAAGIVEGCFIVTGSGAVATLSDTNGTLFSAGAFSGGSKSVASADVINVSYSVSV